MKNKFEQAVIIIATITIALVTLAAYSVFLLISKCCKIMDK